jgi:hypothetical protein
LDVATIKGLRCGSPVLIAHETEARLRDCIMEVNAPDVYAGVPGCVVAAWGAEAGVAVKVIRSGGCAYWKPLPPPVDVVLARPAWDVEEGAAV